jgi:hypothetical protein
MLGIQNIVEYIRVIILTLNFYSEYIISYFAEIVLFGQRNNIYNQLCLIHTPRIFNF